MIGEEIVLLATNSGKASMGNEYFPPLTKIRINVIMVMKYFFIIIIIIIIIIIQLFIFRDNVSNDACKTYSKCPKT